MIEGTFEFIRRRRWWLLMVALLFSAWSLEQVFDLETGEFKIDVDPSPNRLLPEDNEARQFYDFVRKLFGSDETLVVALRSDDLFSTEGLRRVQRITSRIDEIDSVHHVVSLSNAINIRGVGLDIEVEPFFEAVPTDPNQIESIQKAVMDNPIYAGNLVSKDGKTTALVVHFMRITDRDFIRKGIDGQILKILEEEKGTAEAWLTGTPRIKAAQTRTILSELGQSLPLIALLGALVLALSFRTLRGVFLPILAVSLALLWTLGITAWLGKSLNLVTVLVPPLLMILGLSYAVHVVSEFDDALRGGRDPAGATVRALRKVWLPVMLTGLTTAAGFLSLALSPLTAIREFGFFSLLGVFFCVIAALTITPALLEITKPRAVTTRAENRGARFARFSTWFAQFDLKNRYAIMIVAAIVGALSIGLSTQIEIGSDHIRTFPEDSPVRIHFEQINEHLQGANTINIVVQTDYPEAFKEPVYLQAIENLQTWLNIQPEIGGTTSIVDYVKLIHRSFNRNDPEFFVLPETKRMVGQMLFFGASDELDRYVDSQYQIANIVARTKVIDSQLVRMLTERIELELTRLRKHLDATVTGNPVLINRMLDEIVRGQVVSMGGAIVLIYVILVVMFLSFRTGFIALIPNVLPILAYFGILGLSGIKLSPGTSLIAPMALGIAIDDTIHYFARFNHDAKRYADERRGTIAALRAVGRPVTFTSLAICLGFLVLTTSDLKGQAELGLLGAFTLGFAWLVDFTLTPALCAGLRVVTLWDTLTLDLGQAPHVSIPAFHGLSQAQARIVALMASVRRIPAGQMLIRAQERGREMYVVVDGTLQVSIEGEEGKIPLNTCGRGDVIGEVGFFYKTRSADVEVVEDARLLRLTQKNMQRLLRRYPRIAAQVFRNINATLAQRLAKTTERLR